ncbi:MAG TPA: hypothetical protein VE973_03060 [Candidatus Limnocylindria bacterium]|nr:hypothetical protein [Candidatus Limnocylindria bacterium]
MNLPNTEKLKSYFTNVWFLWALCLIFNIITFLFIYFKIHPGNKTLALHYNVLVGVEWYGKGKNLYFIPGVGLLISGVNFVLYRSFKNNEVFLASLTVFVSLSVQLILLGAALFLSRVN